MCGREAVDGLFESRPTTVHEIDVTVSAAGVAKVTLPLSASVTVRTATARPATRKTRAVRPGLAAEDPEYDKTFHHRGHGSLSVPSKGGNLPETARNRWIPTVF